VPLALFRTARQRVPRSASAATRIKTVATFSTLLQVSIEFVAASCRLEGLRIGYRTSRAKLALARYAITDESTKDSGINRNNLAAYIRDPAHSGFEFRHDYWQPLVSNALA
jgi:hypothetical protein